MKDDIKEWLDYFKKYATISEKAILEDIEDYIIKLQEELENKNNEIDVLKDQVEWWKQQCDDLEMQIGENNG